MTEPVIRLADLDVAPHPADDPREVERHQDQAGGGTAAEWEDPVPLTGMTRPLPKFPVQVLPDWMAAMIRAVARFHDTPDDIPAIVALGCISIGTGRRARISVAGWQREEVNAYLLAALDSGHRKSGPYSVMAKRPLLDAQQRLQEEEDARAQADARDPVRIRLFTTNATPAALRDLAAGNGERLGIMSSEGGVFDELAGRYDRIPDIDLVLAGWNGEPYHADRATKPVPPMNRPVLTICLTAQPAVLKDMAGKPSFRDRGLLARYLYSLPEDIVGRRANKRPAIPADVTATYFENMSQLLTELHHAKEMEWSLSDDAFKLFHDAEMAIEPKLARGAQYGGNDGMREWASKLMGQVLKLAGILHAAEYASGTWRALGGEYQPPARISEQTMRDALTLGEYFLAHAEATFGLMRADPLVNDAEAVLDWIKHIDWTGKTGGRIGAKIASHPGIVTRREVQTGVWAIRNADHAAAVLRLLDKAGYIREAESARRDSIRYGIHPSLCQKTSALSALADFDDVPAGQMANQSAETRLCTPLHSSALAAPDDEVQRSAEQVQRPLSALAHTVSPAETVSTDPSAESAEEFQPADSQIGPCTWCGEPCTRYGPKGKPVCDHCTRGETEARPSPLTVARHILPKRQP